MKKCITHFTHNVLRNVMCCADGVLISTFTFRCSVFGHIIVIPIAIDANFNARLEAAQSAETSRAGNVKEVNTYEYIRTCDM